MVPPADNNVTRVEEDLGSAQPGFERLGLKALTPLRPGYGTKGDRVLLWANYVEMIPEPKLILYRYAMKTTPTVTGRKLTQIIRLMLESPELANFKNDTVTDFKSTCVSRQRFPTDDHTISIVYRAEDEDQPRPNATTYNVRLQYTNTLRAGELVDYLSSTDIAATCDNKLALIQAFNIFLNHYAKSANTKVATIGSSRFFTLDPQPNQQWNLGQGLTAMRGFFASVRAATCRILVNVNVSHASFYQSGPLESLMDAYGLKNPYKLAGFLKRVRVRTTHLQEKFNKAGKLIPRIKTIFGLATPNDGGELAHRPRVARFGAGPKEVEFWLESAPNTSAPAQPSVPSAKPTSPSQTKKKGGKGGKRGGDPAPPASSLGGRYISVYDFFAQGKPLRSLLLPSR